MGCKPSGGQYFSKNSMASSKEISAAERERYYKAFRMFDKNGGGMISAKELGSVMRQLGKNPTTGELNGMFRESLKISISEVELPFRYGIGQHKSALSYWKV